MGEKNREKPAFLIIDMVNDNFDDSKNLPITPLAKKIIGPINDLIKVFRKQCWPVVFSTDAFRKEDFIFQAHMKPHSLVGTPGAKVIDELDRRNEDLWLPKPRFSAFFRTHLDQWLRERNVTLCAVGGITTNVCVLTTLLDAIAYDFKAVLLEDCTAASFEYIHQQILNSYRRNPLYPLLRVTNSREFAAVLQG